MSLVYSATTRGVTVSVRTAFLEEQSDPDEGRFAWAYRIRIANESEVTVQLLKRTWHITDARGHVEVVHGEGVVGDQPVLEPGKHYEYQSGTPLATSSGVMVGLYHMIETHSGAPFDVQIPAFSLDLPNQARQLH